MMITEKLKELTKRDSNSQQVNASSYFAGDNALVYATIDAVRINDDMKLIDKLKSSGINVFEIRAYSLDEDEFVDYIDEEEYQDGWIVEQRAKGHHIHEPSEVILIGNSDEVAQGYSDYFKALRKYASNMAEYANASQKHFDKFIRDYLTIEQTPLIVEPKVTNFYYDKEDGFSFVNLHSYGNDKRFEIGEFVQNVLNVLIYQPPHIVVYDELSKQSNKSIIIDGIPNEIYDGLKVNVVKVLDNIIMALRHAPIRQKIVDNSLEKYFEVKSNLFRGGINQDDIIYLIEDSLKTISFNNSVKKDVK